MNYTNYETAIVERYRVNLVGWTFPRLVSPSEIGTIDDIRTLRDALKTGACKWVRLSKRELAAHSEAVAQWREDGEVIGKKRKERSNKGVKRKRKDKGREEEDEESAEDVAGPSKKKKTTLRPKPKPKPKPTNHKSQLPPTRRVKSKAVISDSDSEEGSGDT